MRHILIIEPSATMRLGINRLLQDSYVLQHSSDYKEGLEKLAHAAASNRPYAGLILHWPSLSDHASDELIALLSEPEQRELAVLILANESNASNRDWISMRPCSAMLHLENIDELKHSLDTLLKVTPQAKQPAIAPDHSDPISILFVDDSPTVRAKFRRLLTSRGYRLESAGSLQEAMQLTEEHLFDIAIIDYFMPYGNGDELCRQLKQSPHTAHITCAILTGTYLDKVITDSLDAGAVECMFKNEADTLFLARVAAMSRSVQISKRTEAERRRLDGILESVGEGVYGVNSDGVITFVNPSAKRILGYPAKFDLIGLKPQALFHRHCPGEQGTEHDLCALQEAYQQGEEVSALETVFTRQNGSTIQVELTIRPMLIDNKLEGAVVAFRDISMRKLLEDELKWQANHDPLTKLFNRKYFEDALQREVERLRRGGETCALLYLDLDRFKYINDTAGHAAGDQLLVEIAHQLENRLRETDLLARLGGDEFAIILRNVSKESLLEVAENFRTMLAEHTFSYDSRSYKVNGSIGIAQIDRHCKTAGEVLANADIACHIAKGKGRNQSHLFEAKSDRRVAMDMELGWSAKLEDALANDNFALHYQPIVPLIDVNLALPAEPPGTLWPTISSQTLSTAPMFEVLLRLHDARGETISPNAFLPTAERFNMMPRIDSWVLQQAFRQLVELRAQNIPATLTINLSGQSLCDPQLKGFIQHQLESLALDPRALIFEITETCAVANIEAARRLINELNALGCAFALDDFGSGYCSFSHLKNLAVDYIKIEGSFIQGLAHDEMDAAIVRSINEIAHSLGKKTIAEHVENRQVLQALQDCGVDYIQGYYIAPPAQLDTHLSTPASLTASSARAGTP